MALKTYIFVVTNCLCFYFCHPFPQPSSNQSFANFVSDGKKDCDLINHNQNVIELFKTVSCPDQIKIFHDNYFEQRDILPCFGAYDALYNLCELRKENMNFETPEIFKDSAKFCTEAKAVYDHNPFIYKNEKVKKWGTALLLTMTNETLCNNLCVLNNEINPECIAMVTFTHEYLQLKGIIEPNLKLKPIIVAPLNNQTTMSKPTTEVVISSAESGKDAIGSANPKHPSESTNLGSGDSPLTPSKEAGETEIKTGVIKEDIKVGSNHTLPIDTKPANPSPVIDNHNIEDNVPETIAANKLSNINNKFVNTSPVTSTSSMPKVPPNTFEEGMNDENDKTFTEVDDVRGENDEAIPGEGKEKGNLAHRLYLASSPFSLLQNVPHSFMNPLKRTSTSHSMYEENEKPNEEEKNTAPDTEQHAAYHGGISPPFNPMSDSFSESEDSYSFTYIVTTMAALCCVYLLFHYRNKLLALALEGRKGRSSRGRGRPSSANYSKLHSNLEEAIASNVTTPSATHVLY